MPKPESIQRRRLRRIKDSPAKRKQVAASLELLRTATGWLYRFPTQAIATTAFEVEELFMEYKDTAPWGRRRVEVNDELEKFYAAAARAKLKECIVAIRQIKTVVSLLKGKKRR